MDTPDIAVATTTTSTTNPENLSDETSSAVSYNITLLEREILYVLGILDVTTLSIDYLLLVLTHDQQLSKRIKLDITADLNKFSPPTTAKPKRPNANEYTVLTLAELKKTYPKHPIVSQIANILETKHRVFVLSEGIIRNLVGERNWKEMLDTNATTTDKDMDYTLVAQRCKELFERVLDHAWTPQTRELSWFELGTTLTELWKNDKTNYSYIPPPHLLAEWYITLHMFIHYFLSENHLNLETNIFAQAVFAVWQGVVLLTIIRDTLLPFSIHAWSHQDNKLLDFFPESKIPPEFDLALKQIHLLKDLSHLNLPTGFLFVHARMLRPYCALGEVFPAIWKYTQPLDNNVAQEVTKHEHELHDKILAMIEGRSKQNKSK